MNEIDYGDDALMYDWNTALSPRFLKLLADDGITTMGQLLELDDNAWVRRTWGAGGKALTAGKVDRAMRELTQNTKGSSPVSLLNNLCVAHTVLREWDEARDSCDAAVAAATEQRAEARRWSSERRRLANKVAAAVYSNRAVMNWLSNDARAAQGDIARASSIAPKANFVVRNAELAARLPARVGQASQPAG